jgi:hypothetical protein
LTSAPVVAINGIGVFVRLNSSGHRVGDDNDAKVPLSPYQQHDEVDAAPSTPSSTTSSAATPFSPSVTLTTPSIHNHSSNHYHQMASSSSLAAPSQSHTHALGAFSITSPTSVMGAASTSSSSSLSISQSIRRPYPSPAPVRERVTPRVYEPSIAAQRAANDMKSLPPVHLPPSLRQPLPPLSSFHDPKRRGIRVLSIDASGSCGVITATILQRIESLLGGAVLHHQPYPNHSCLSIYLSIYPAIVPQYCQMVDMN